MKAVEKWGGVGDKGVRESNGKVEWTKVKYTYSRNTLRNSFEY
jgi:hypothetical protein